jgi:hypothetical protein
MIYVSRENRGAAAQRFGLRRWLGTTVLSGTALFSACPPALPIADAHGDASAADVLAMYDDVQFGAPVCGDDEQLDSEFDKRLSIDCAAVRAAVDARRTPAERLAQGQLVAYMRSTLHRCCVSREQLVARMRPVDDEGAQQQPAPMPDRLVRTAA